MYPRLLRHCALLCLVLWTNGTIAGRLGQYRRQDDAATPTTESLETTADGNGEQTTTSATSLETTSEGAVTVTATPSVSSVISVTALPTAINGNTPDDTDVFNNSTVVPGELPLKPQMTPGWGVAGAILLVTGVVYALIGIKNAMLHTFFSTAYLASLCITVLIIYILVPPVPDAVEGAYVVAAVCTGAILGGAATIFKELTEGLGCLLGGFCFSMWLLTLKEGGLLSASTERIIFITVFTLAGYALYFSRYTRAYALIGLMSFSGATVTVLGIDCFSRAGLKEYWVYLWSLNDKIFPLNTDTYPLTKGIRVEIAAIVVLTVIGVISQIKLWRVVQQHRAKRAEERAELDRQRDDEEANLGRQIEESNARERRQWESAYGDPPPSSSAGSADSGVGDVDNEKKGVLSEPTVKRVSSNEDTIELTEMATVDACGASDPAKHTNGLVMTDQDTNRGVTVRVVAEGREDAGTTSAKIPESEEKVWIVGSEGDARPASMVTPRESQRWSKPTSPEVIPLPFRVPESDELAEREDGDRSSFATFADEDARSITLSKRASRASLGNRLSVGSANLLRSLSQLSHNSKRKTGEFDSPQPSPRWGGSAEDLVSENRRSEDAGSICATVDGLSQDGAGDTRKSEPGLTVEVIAELADGSSKNEDNAEVDSRARTQLTTEGRYPSARHSNVETIATDILDPSILGDIPESKSKRSSTTHIAPKTDATDENTDTSGAETYSEVLKTPQSGAPSTTSTRASLTKDRLPSGLSRVAMSYRTNEWAKHLSLADAPEPEELQLRYLEQDAARKKGDIPVPVKVDELQQTVENGSPAPVVIRSSSSVPKNPTSVPAPGSVHRSPSRESIVSSTPNLQDSSTLKILTGQNPDPGTQTSPVKATAPRPLHNAHSFRGKNRRQSGDVTIEPILEEHTVDHLSHRPSPTPRVSSESTSDSGLSSPGVIDPQTVTRNPVPGIVSYSSPQTLIGKREMFLRSKSQSMLIAPPIPGNKEQPTRAASQMDLHQNYRMSSPFTNQDPDDLPLSQRKELMRQNSMLSVRSVSAKPRPDSSMSAIYEGGPSRTPTPRNQADKQGYDSHQPKRGSTLPSPLYRESRLASFRQSVAADLRAGTPVVSVTNNGRETPMFAASTTSLLGARGPANGSNHVVRSIEQQRSMLMSQREQEAQRREMELWEKERNDRAFEERMRRGDLIDAHREAMRKMQSGVKDR
ncbi:hypothetical protein F4778DRAFT_634121 [Xylariomycetidae sp. FL2044]|nr:hypothetical protein F4778DRAFT_634121 [Xylariomycetidae sp. FL2044]